MIKQVRTKSNAFSTVRYDKDGNILTPSRLRALKKAKKEKSDKLIKGGKWVKITSQFYGNCSVCSDRILIGVPILWNKKNKQTKHIKCPS
jgi:hypothetical protein